jgi:lysophospholipase L1-like esterase
MARSLSRLWLWGIPAAVGAAAALLFAVGFCLALAGSLGEPQGEPAPAPAAAAEPVKAAGHRFLLVLGDSLARGTGDETGSGFATYVLRYLRKSGPVDMANLAVNGAESGDVLPLLAGENVRRLAAAADWTILSVGGNDLSHSVTGEAGGISSPLAEISASRTRYAGNLREILSRLRQANPRAPIFVVGLYDPFGSEGPQARIGASVILSWNALVEETALSFPNVSVVPTFDLFYRRPDRLAADHFHPNGKGHQAIADRIVQLFPGA